LWSLYLQINIFGLIQKFLNFPKFQLLQFQKIQFVQAKQPHFFIPAVQLQLPIIAAGTEKMILNAKMELLMEAEVKIMSLGKILMINNQKIPIK
jgi:hypothetical protein